MTRSSNRFAGAAKPALGNCAASWRFPLSMFLVTVSVCSLVDSIKYTGTIFEEANPAAPIRGQNYDGAPFDLAQLIGDPVLLFFGYTFCPDVCPLTMIELAAAKRSTGIERGPRPRGRSKGRIRLRRPPTRQPRHESSHTFSPLIPGSFGSSCTGNRTGCPSNRATACTPAPPEGHSTDDEYYLLDHTSRIFLIDREGNWRALFSADVTAEALAADLQELLALDRLSHLP